MMGGEGSDEKAALVAWMETVSKVLGEVSEERVRQQIKWGEQNHPNGTGPGPMWRGIFGVRGMAQLAEVAKSQVDYDAQRGTLTYAGILLEEVFEALSESDPERLRAELVQVSAVAAAWVEKIDRDRSQSCPTCGPTQPENHPHRPGITRCANCKTWLVAADYDPATDCSCPPPWGNYHTANPGCAQHAFPPAKPTQDTP